MMWYGPGFGVYGLISMIVFWIIIVALALIFLRYFSTGGRDGKGPPPPPPPRRPLDILQERYARGEIDKKEYEEKKKDLSKD